MSNPMDSVTAGYVVLNPRASADARDRSPYYSWMPDAALVASDPTIDGILAMGDYNLDAGDTIHAAEYHEPASRTAHPYRVSPHSLATWDGKGWLFH